MGLPTIAFAAACFVALGVAAQQHGDMRGEHQASATEVGSPADGKRVFQQKGCISCHAIRGAGGKVGPDLGRLQHTHNIYQMAGVMWNHSQQMRQAMEKKDIERPEFEGDEMADLLAYLHSLKVVGDAEAGRAVFGAKSCAQCHAIDGIGGKIGPELARTKHPHPPIELVGMMWNHSPEMTALMQAMKITRPEFVENEMADLMAYLDMVQRRSAGKR